MSYSAGQKMANRKYNQKHRHEAYLPLVSPAVVGLDSTADFAAIEAAISSVAEFANGGKISRRNMREAARAILGIDQPVPTPAIVRTARGTYCYQQAGNVGSALTPEECRQHGRTPGSGNL